MPEAVSVNGLLDSLKISKDADAGVKDAHTVNGAPTHATAVVPPYAT